MHYFLLEADTSIEIVERYLNKGPSTTIFVLEDEKVLGTITNGDFRRYILNRKSDHRSAAGLCNKNFVFAESLTYSDQEIDQIFKSTFLQHIPVLNKDLTIDKIISRRNIGKPVEKCDVVIMAGGKGNRLMPLTENTPKPMLKINETPILEILLKQLAANHFDKFYFSVNYKKDVIKEHFRDGIDFGVTVKYIEEDQFEGTAASLRLLKNDVSDNVLVMNGDVLTRLNFDQLSDYHFSNDNDITVVLNKVRTKIEYGVVELDKSDIVGITEKPELEHFISAGIYLIKSSLLKYIPKSGFFDMPDLIDVASKNNLKVQGYPLTEYWLDIGHIETLEEARRNWK